MDLYYRLFRDYGLPVGQILTTKLNFEPERERENQRACMEVMLQHGVVPIVNENDTVSTSEIEFGDNDTLSAVVSAIIGADLLILLSDINGLYTDDPGKNKDAEFISCVSSIDDSIYALAKGTSGDFGTGLCNL